MAFLAPPDGADVAYEFFAPFAHVEGKYEWCRIRSPTHGVFDTFILIERSPVVVYVNDDAGERFMKERYPECSTFRVAKDGLRIEERDGGLTVVGALSAKEGPVRAARMTLQARPVLNAPAGASASSPQAAAVVPRQVPYGGLGHPVWGSKRWTCWGVDLALEGQATGAIEFAEGYATQLARERCIVTLGSFGRIASLP